MKINLGTIVFLLFFHEIAFAKEGMPQLNPEFWLSQIVWLTIVFALLYFLIQKFFSPKLFALIDTRTNFIKSLLEEAEVCKNQIQKLEDEYNLIITEAKIESKKISAKLKNDLNDIEVLKEYNLITLSSIPNDKFDAIVLGVSHKEFLKLNFAELQKSNSLIYDVKGVLGSLADAKL